MSNTHDDLVNLFASVTRNEPVSHEALALWRTQLHLPVDYEQVLQVANGIEGFIGDVYIRLWRLEDIKSKNEMYNTEEFTPGLMFIGSDGSEIAYGLDMREGSATHGHYASVPFINDGWDEVEILSATFIDFINALM